MAGHSYVNLPVMSSSVGMSSKSGCRSLTVADATDAILPSCSSPAAAVRDFDQETDYKRRCQHLETSLIKFKEKATRIRELLTVKMQEMESQVVEANRRTAVAEDRCRELERVLSTGSSLPGAGCKLNFNDSCMDYSTIVQLRAQLQEQKDLRAMEARMVAEKSSKIREWVTRKVQQLELRNQQLGSENTSLREEAELLRARLKQAAIAADVHVVQNDAGSNGWNNLGNRHPLAESTETAMTTLDYYSDYQEVVQDESNITGQSSSAAVILSVNEPGAVSKCAPRINIERKQFINVCDAMTVSTASSVTSTGTSRGDQPFNASGNQSVDSDSQTPVELTPKEPPNVATPFLPGAPPNSPHVDGSGGVIAVTLPRCKKDSQRLFAGSDNNSSQANGPSLEYGPVMTIDRKYKTQPRPKPPNPPARKLPSWESRIYSMITGGLQFPHDVLVSEHSSSSLANQKVESTVTVPVYATVKGRAACIRKSPFSQYISEDSSSDGEDYSSLPPTKRQSCSQQSKTASFKERNSTGQQQNYERLSCKLIQESSSLNHQLPNDGSIKKPLSRDGSYSSLASETSSDYAFPPEDGCSIQTESSDVGGQLTKSTTEEAQLVAEKKGSSSWEKSGYLLKLSGQFKLWKRRWFVIKGGKLVYYRTSSGLCKQSSRSIDIDPSAQVMVIAECQQMFQIVCSKKTYYLMAGSPLSCRQWVRLIRHAIHASSTDQAAPHVSMRIKDIISGWLVKVTNGRRRRCWCSIVGKNLIYYKSPGEQAPLGQICLQGCQVSDVVRACDPDSDSSGDDGILDSAEFTVSGKYTVALLPPNDSPSYLLFATEKQKENWLYQLIVASAGGGNTKACTDLEQLIYRLMAVDGDAACSLWYDPVLLCTKEMALQKPLTSLHSDDLHRQALEMFKMVRSFTCTLVDPSQCDYHVAHAQSLFACAVKHRELQTELYCQLIKQTSKHPPQPKQPGVQHFLLCGSHSWFQCDTSPTSPTTYAIDAPESKLNPPNYVIVQGWQLLTLAISLFLPSHLVLWLLKMHLQRYADSRTEYGRYAVFCQCALERMLHNGSRQLRPSRLEVLSVILRNPFYHSQPISIPVHLANGSYQVVSFDGSTTVTEFLGSLEKAIGARDSLCSGFALFTDDPTEVSLEHWVTPDAKLCDVISKWEQEYVQSCSKGFDATRTIRLIYKNRLYLSKMNRSETEKERLLLVYQTNSEVIAGRFPLSRDMAIELAALMAQLEFGDYKSASESGSSHLLLRQAVDNFYPTRYRLQSADETKRLEQRVSEAWKLLRGKGSVDCVRVYLTVARKWQFFGAKLFICKLKRDDINGETVWLAVGERGIAVLDYTSMSSRAMHSYSNVVMFGGLGNDLFIVIDNADSRSKRRSERLLFALPKIKILEVTQLIASYVSVTESRKSDPLISASGSWKA